MKNLLLTVLSLLFLHVAFGQEKPEGLFINSKAPEIKAKDQNGNDVVLKDLRKKGNVVVVFYRGNWCPYCSRFLKKLQDSLDFIRAKGAQLIVITPESGAGIDSSAAKSGAQFPIISDKDMKISNGYKVAFKVDEKTLGRYKMSGIDLLKNNNQIKNAYLPVPAVYIVNTEGTITFRFFEEDYKKRLTIKDLLQELD